MIDANYFSIADLASVQGGYPFRGSIDDQHDGSALAIQMKDVDPELGVNWASATRTELIGRKQPDWLTAGDILFVSKGARFYAVCLDEPPMPAVCSPHFFHLRVEAQTIAVPAFIAWQINQAPFQKQLQQAAVGSSQLSIRRPVLEMLRLSIPSVADQHRIVALTELARQERLTLHRLIQNREQQLGMLANALFQATNKASQEKP